MCFALGDTNGALNWCFHLTLPYWFRWPQWLTLHLAVVPHPNPFCPLWAYEGMPGRKPATCKVWPTAMAVHTAGRTSRTSREPYIFLCFQFYLLILIVLHWQ